MQFICLHWHTIHTSYICIYVLYYSVSAVEKVDKIESLCNDIVILGASLSVIVFKQQSPTFN